MYKVVGKMKLCSCSLTHFKAIQGIGNIPLTDRFDDIANLINKNIEIKYRHFLSQPVANSQEITWYATSWSATPQRLTELTETERPKYEAIKTETINHYKSVIEGLKNKKSGSSEADILSNALKFINDDFVYCYDNLVVLGIWGMQVRENIREPLGVVCKNMFVKKNQLLPELPPPDSTTAEQLVGGLDDAVEPVVNLFNVRFSAGESGSVLGTADYIKQAGETIGSNEIPKIEPNPGFEFIGWDKKPDNYSITSDTEFTARYKLITKPRMPWYLRFWNWLRSLFIGSRWLKWLLWFFLALLLLLLLSWLFRGCGSSSLEPIPNPINDKPWIKDDPRVGDKGGIYDPGNPYESVPTPPDYGDVLPPKQGLLPPIDTSEIIREPNNPIIIGNRLNILMQNEDKSIMDLAKAFKVKYPDDKYKVVYYDDVVKRMQIEVPSEERSKLKHDIPEKFAPDYELFVFDESLFETNYTPSDPDFSDPNKAWYFNVINAQRAWDITRGSPKLTVAIVDNGFSLKHPELNSKVVMPYNVWLQSKEIFAQQVDHGTHVAGTALAIANNGKGLCGIAPECAFMPVQVANKQGLMTTTSVLDGVLYALYQGADVLNISLGLSIYGQIPENEQRNLQNNRFKEEERLWKEVMKIANKHKAVIVISAGNDNILAGVNPMTRPKNFIVVSALDKSNRAYEKAGFSNYGEFSSISAPGVSISSSVGNNNYQIMDGTSMAAPIVTGAVALMKSLNDSLTAEQIVCILQATGKPAEGKVGNLIQIDNALQKVKSGEFTDCEKNTDQPSTGDVQVLLSWNNYNDLDLVCTDPNNETVWFENKKVSSGGQLEIDKNVEFPDTETPIENIYWPKGAAPNGTYRVHLIYYKKHIDVDETAFKIMVKYGDKTETFTNTIKGEGTYMNICTFTLGNAGQTSNPSNPRPPNAGRNNENLQRERERLQKQLDDIDRELEKIKNNKNIKK